MTISEYTKAAVKKYLKTVLFVDDTIFQQTEQLYMDEVPDMPDSGTAREVSTIQKQDSQIIEIQDNQFDIPQAIVDGFAAHGIVCGLYQPQPSDFSGSDAFKRLVALCDHADVFILDWKLTNDVSNSPVLILLNKFLKQRVTQGSPRPIRFCVIYTSRPINTVFTDLVQHLQREFPQLLIEQSASLVRIKQRGITIKIYCKNEKLPNYVASSKLAQRIIRDFTSEYKGIMSATALYGIAAVRDNAKRILDIFPPSLDYALMVHAGLTVEAPTVPEDIQDLLSDEIHSILSEYKVSDDDCFSMFQEKCNDVKEEQLNDVFTTDELKDGKTAKDVKQFFVSLFQNRKLNNLNPFKECQSSHKSRRVSHELLQKLQKLVGLVADKKSYSDGALSRLFCLRTVYNDKRILKSGTIVRNLSDNFYYLCLMPTCDCVRLAKKKTSFPFWSLTKVDSSHEGRAHGIVILNENNESLSLCLKGKIRKQMKFWTFQPDNEVFFTRDPNNHKFLLYEASDSENKTKFEWIAELKPLHAQRMIEYVSQQFSRVGLAESEWLRLQVDR